MKNEFEQKSETSRSDLANAQTVTSQMVARKFAELVQQLENSQACCAAEIQRTAECLRKEFEQILTPQVLSQSVSPNDLSNLGNAFNNKLQEILEYSRVIE